MKNALIEKLKLDAKANDNDIIKAIDDIISRNVELSEISEISEKKNKELEALLSAEKEKSEKQASDLTIADERILTLEDAVSETKQKNAVNILDAKALKKVAMRVFKDNPDAKIIYATQDGSCFFSQSLAVNHKASLGGVIKIFRK